MILPTESSHDVASWRRQLILDIGPISSAASASSAINPTSKANETPTGKTVPSAEILNAPKDSPKDEKPTVSEPEEDAGTITITSKTRKSSSTSSSTEKEEGNVLSQAVANSNLSWWQLICVAVAGAMFIAVAVWVIYRQRKKKKEDSDRKKEVEALEKDIKVVEEGKVKASIEAKGESGKKRDDDDESSGWDSEEYDTLSDGGTIRPRRRRGGRRDKYRSSRRGRHRDRGRDYYSSDESDFSYREPSRRIRDHRRRRQPSPSPSPPPPRLPKRGRRKSFVDSVFSTFQSMKDAAIDKRQDEMDSKLKQALEDEERIEKARQMKVREANAEIKKFALEREREKIRMEVEAELRGKQRIGSSDSR